MVQKPEPASKHHKPWKTLFRGSERSTLSQKQFTSTRFTHRRGGATWKQVSCFQCKRLNEKNTKHTTTEWVSRSGIQPPEPSAEKLNVKSSRALTLMWMPLLQCHLISQIQPLDKLRCSYKTNRLAALTVSKEFTSLQLFIRKHPMTEECVVW